MRQDVLTSWLVPAAGRLVGPLLVCLVVGFDVGCQVATPGRTGSLPAQLGQGVSSSYKPPSDDKTPTAVPPGSASSATARIRGQSPATWNPGPAGYSDASRGPMPATDASAGINRYINPSPAPAAGGQFVTAPLASSTSPSDSPSAAQANQLPAPAAATPLPASTTVYQPAVGGNPATGSYGYGTPGSYQQPGTYGLPSPQPNDYGSTIAPGVTQLPNTQQSTIAPGAYPVAPYDPAGLGMPDITAPGGIYQPRQRIAPIDVYAQEARTGRIILGGSVNSDLGLAGQLIIDERNFDIGRVPGSWSELWSGRAFRGGGQNFRAEIMPGNRVQRYTVNWTERNLFGYLPYSLSVGGFLYTRQYNDWTEQRLGGRAALGYEVTKDLSISSELRLEDVKLSDPRLSTVDELNSALGSNDVYTARFRVARDTRDSPFMSTEGALLELIFDQVFGEYDYSRGNINYSRYFLVRERADGGGRHTLASSWKVGVTGSQTPIFENYFAGGYSTLRGFSFRGASPTDQGVQVGGEMMFLGSLEYVFPLTADEMLRGVAFVDYGTVERDLTLRSENFRVAPGLGLRVSVPALGPAPLAFDFAYPINHAENDDRQIFSFFMGLTR